MICCRPPRAVGSDALWHSPYLIDQAGCGFRLRLSEGSDWRKWRNRLKLIGKPNIRRKRVAKSIRGDQTLRLTLYMRLFSLPHHPVAFLFLSALSNYFKSCGSPADQVVWEPVPEVFGQSVFDSCGYARWQAAVPCLHGTNSAECFMKLPGSSLLCRRPKL